MHRFAHPLLPLTLLFALGAAPVPADMSMEPQVTILRQRVVIRVPRMVQAEPMRRRAAVEWREQKGPRCLFPRDLAGAVVPAPAVVDLVLVDGSRVRAKLEKDCRSADFYSGLYLKPGTDGRVCADRDAFRVRSGTRCEIRDFRRLVAKR